MLKNSPLFILGVPRSGTTLLAELLSKTKYGEAFETHFIPKYHQALTKYHPLSEKQQIIHLLKEITKERVVAHWEMDIEYDAFYHDLTAPITYQQIINQLCLYSENKQKHEFWGDKTPQYLEEIELITQLFPTSKFIHIIRDGRDVALSLLQKTWGPNNIYTCAQYWKKLNQKADYLQQKIPKEQIYSLRYEDLLANSENQLTKIYQFLGEDILTDKIKQQIKQQCQLIKKSNTNKWKRHLTSSQIKCYEEVTARLLSKNDYKTSHDEKKTTQLKQLYYQSHDKLMLIKHLIILNVIDGIKIKFFGKKPFAE